MDFKLEYGLTTDLTCRNPYAFIMPSASDLTTGPDVLLVAVVMNRQNMK